MNLKDGRPLPEGREFIRFLNEIEDRIAPASFSFEAFNYWPIVRFALNGKRAGKALKGEGALPRVGALPLAKLALKKALRLRKHEKTAYPSGYFSGLPKADVLFLNRDTQYNTNLHGYSIQFFTDGLRHLAGEGVSCATLVSRDPRKGDERFWTETLIMPRVKTAGGPRLLSPSSLDQLTTRDRVIAKIEDVNAIIKELGVDHEVNTRYILQRIDRTIALIKYFELLFTQVQPKIVYLSSFTGAYHICVAARRMGIKVVDIQHGGMHQNHPLAANWRHVPEQGYELLPDYFWCWSERTAQYISSTFADRHRAIVGGNPKAAFEKEVFEQRKLPGGADTKKECVLVALQYGQSALVAPHVKRAFEQTKNRVEWRFRLHPRGFDRLDEASQLLDVSKKDILSASERPLHQVFPEADCLLTDASTIVYEALDHGVRPAVWSDKGAAFFDDLRASDELQLVSNTDQVVDFVTSCTHESSNRARGRENEVAAAELNLIRSQFHSLING